MESAYTGTAGRPAVKLGDTTYHVVGVFHGDRTNPPSEDYVYYVRDEIGRISDNIVCEQGLASVFGYDPVTEMQDQKFGSKWVETYCKKEKLSAKHKEISELMNLMGDMEAFLETYWALLDEEEEFIKAAELVVYETPTRFPEVRDSYHRYVLPGALSLEEKAWYSFAHCNDRQLCGLLECMPLMPNRIEYMANTLQKKGNQEGSRVVVAIVGLAHEQDLAYVLQNPNCNAYGLMEQLFMYNVLG